MTIEYFVLYNRREIRSLAYAEVTLRGTGRRTREVPERKLDRVFRDRGREAGLRGFKRKSQADKLCNDLRKFWADAEVVSLDLDAEGGD